MTAPIVRAIVLSIVFVAFVTSAQAQLTSGDSISFPQWHENSSTAILPSLDSSLAIFPNAVDSVTLNFDRVLSLSTWTGGISYSGSRQSGAEGGNLHYQAVAQGRMRYREESQTLGTELASILGTEVPVSGRTSLFATLTGSTYSTKSSAKQTILGAANDLIDGYAIAGVSTPLDVAKFSIGAGLATQRQSGSTAAGPIVRSLFSLPVQEIGEGEYFDSYASFDERFYRGGDQNGGEQRFSSDRATLHLNSLITEGGVNDVQLIPSYLRRDLYFRLDTSSFPAKQSRSEVAIQLSDQLVYPLVLDRLTSFINVDVESRSVSRRTFANKALFTSTTSASSLLAPSSVGGLRFQTTAQFVLGANGFDSTLLVDRVDYNGAPVERLSSSLAAALRYEERSEDVTLAAGELGGVDQAVIRKLSDVLSQASFSSRMTQIGFAGKLALGAKTQASADATARIQRYDTPSQLNRDDRDDQLISARLGLLHRWSDQLYSLLDVRTSRGHIVYLEGDRSAQNAVTQTISLTSESGYTSQLYTNLARAEVTATYTVLDYLERIALAGEAGSYLLRSFNLRDSLQVRLGSIAERVPLRLEGSIDLRVSERGAYNQPRFTEERSALNNEFSGELRLASYVWQGLAPISVALGARGFWLTRYGIRTATSGEQWELLDKQSRVGPTATVIALHRGTGPELYCDLWYAVVVSGIPGVESRSPYVESPLGVRWRY